MIYIYIYHMIYIYIYYMMIYIYININIIYIYILKNGHATIHRDYIWPISYWDDSDDHTPCIPCIVIYRLRYISPLVDQLTCTFYSHVLISTNGKYSFSMGNTICYFRFFEFQVPTVKTREEIEIFPTTLQ